MASQYTCAVCKKPLESRDTYEYRGAYSCGVHIDEVETLRDRERAAIIEEESRKTEVFRGLDLSSDTAVGRANRRLLKRQIEIASQESSRLRDYEKGKPPATDSRLSEGEEGRGDAEYPTQGYSKRE